MTTDPLSDRSARRPSVGISLPLTGRVGEVGQLLAELTDEVRLAEKVGFDLVLIPEHRQGPRITYCSPLTVAAHVLASTSKIQVATGVLVLPAHHPIHLAESLTMLDHLSGGRFRLGVGAGYQAADLEPFGRQLPDRGRLVEESLAALRSLMTEEEADFRGDFVDFDGFKLRPRPLTPQGPPVWMGSWSKAGIRRAATLCDGWIADPIRTVTEVAEMARHYRAAAEDASAASRSVVVMREAWIDDDAKRARQAFADVIVPVFDYYRRRGALSDTASTFDELAADRFVIGDPALCANDVDDITRRTGADSVVLQLRHPGGPDHERVMDGIRGLGAALAALQPTYN